MIFYFFDKIFITSKKLLLRKKFYYVKNITIKIFTMKKLYFIPTKKLFICMYIFYKKYSSM
jgi:hypothetical protein